jgi:hypothetical protein
LTQAKSPSAGCVIACSKQYRGNACAKTLAGPWSNCRHRANQHTNSTDEFILPPRLTLNLHQTLYADASYWLKSNEKDSMAWLKRLDFTS